MNYLNIRMNSKKKLLYNGKLVLGEKLDHNIFSLKFDIPSNFEQVNKYCIFYNKEKNLKLSYRLNEENCVNISSNITQHPIQYDILLVMFKSNELTEDNIICISSKIQGIVNDNELQVGDVEDDTDPFIIILSSDMNDINNSIQSVNSNIETIKTDLVEKIIESNQETQSTVNKIKEQLSTLSTNIVDNMQSKLDELKNKITKDNTTIISKIDENNTKITENTSKIEENSEKIIENENNNKTEILTNNSNNKTEIIEKIIELEKSNNLTYDVLNEVNETIKNQILCREESE